MNNDKSWFGAETPLQSAIDKIILGAPNLTSDERVSVIRGAVVAEHADAAESSQKLWVAVMGTQFMDNQFILPLLKLQLLPPLKHMAEKLISHYQAQTSAEYGLKFYERLFGSYGLDFKSTLEQLREHKPDESSFKSPRVKTTVQPDTAGVYRLKNISKMSSFLEENKTRVHANATSAACADDIIFYRQLIYAFSAIYLTCFPEDGSVDWAFAELIEPVQGYFLLSGHSDSSTYRLDTPGSMLRDLIHQIPMVLSVDDLPFDLDEFSDGYASLSVTLDDAKSRLSDEDWVVVDHYVATHDRIGGDESGENARALIRDVISCIRSNGKAEFPAAFRINFS